MEDLQPHPPTQTYYGKSLPNKDLNVPNPGREYYLFYTGTKRARVFFNNSNFTKDNYDKATFLSMLKAGKVKNI